jgi:hypothetical protein
VVFSATFLEPIFCKASPMRTAGEILKSGEGATLALRTIQIETFRQLREASFEKLSGARGMGAGALALVLDVLTVFGYEPHHDNTPVLPFPTREKEAVALLRAIGIAG